MKNSSTKRNYLFGAFGGVTAVLLGGRCLGITPARGAIAGLALVFLGGGVNAAHAFTDANGVTCPQTLVVQFNNGPFCSGGSSSGPTASTPSAPTSGTHFTPNPYPNYSRAGQGPSGGSGGPGPGAIDYGWAPPPTNRLGMYVSSDSGMSGDTSFAGGGYSLRNSGVSTTDTAGLIAPGTNSASYRENGGGGGLNGTYDASRFVGPSQHLFLNGAFDYTNLSTNFGGVGAGSALNSENYSFRGTALYTNYSTYVALKGSYQFGNNSEFNSSNSSTGHYNSDGYDIDATLGHIFWLLNAVPQPTASRMALKAPPRTSDGYAIGLDLSGHLGYQSDVAKGFTDSSGFVFGDERVQGGETGLQAKLFADVRNYGVIWQPYIAGSVDWRFSYSHVANFPGQLALATGDAVTFADATTFVGGNVGLDVKMTNGWTVGANGFYEHSSDTEIVGGKAYVKIPFGATAVTARY
jgi:hypothetical protein